MILQSSSYSRFSLSKHPLAFGATQALLQGCKPWLCAKAAFWAERSLSHGNPKINSSSLAESCGASCHALLAAAVDCGTYRRQNKTYQTTTKQKQKKPNNQPTNKPQKPSNKQTNQNNSNKSLYATLAGWLFFPKGQVWVGRKFAALLLLSVGCLRVHTQDASAFINI